MPEYLVEDLCVVLTAIGHVAPQLLDVQLTEDLIAFFCVFLGTPALLRNPYVRSKMVRYTPHNKIPVSYWD